MEVSQIQHFDRVVDVHVRRQRCVTFIRKVQRRSKYAKSNSLTELWIYQLQGERRSWNTGSTSRAKVQETIDVPQVKHIDWIVDPIDTWASMWKENDKCRCSRKRLYVTRESTGCIQVSRLKATLAISPSRCRVPLSTRC